MKEIAGDSGVSWIVLSFLKDLSIQTFYAVVRYYLKSTEGHFVDTLKYHHVAGQLYLIC